MPEGRLIHGDCDISCPASLLVRQHPPHPHRYELSYSWMIEWTVARRPNGEVEIRLRGSITEVADFSPLTVDAPRIVLVADGLRFINSTGTLLLQKLLERLRKTSEIAFERCSPTLVAQFNMVPSLAEQGLIRSVITPLECGECVAEADALLDVSTATGIPALPERACEVCGAAMELAELEARYFGFLM